MHKNAWKQKLLQTMQNQQLFKKILFLFFSTFTRFHAAILQNFRSDLRATYTLNCTEKTYAKRLLSELLTQQQNLQTKKTMKKRNFFIYLLQNNATRKNDDKIKTKRMKRKLWLKAQIANRIRAQKC
jgi:ribosomal protein L10